MMFLTKMGLPCATILLLISHASASGKSKSFAFHGVMTKTKSFLTFPKGKYGDEVRVTFMKDQPVTVHKNRGIGPGDYFIKLGWTKKEMTDPWKDEQVYSVSKEEVRELKNRDTTYKNFEVRQPAIYRGDVVTSLEVKKFPNDWKVMLLPGEIVYIIRDVNGETLQNLDEPDKILYCPKTMNDETEFWVFKSADRPYNAEVRCISNDAEERSKMVLFKVFAKDLDLCPQPDDTPPKKCHGKTTWSIRLGRHTCFWGDKKSECRNIATQRVNGSNAPGGGSVGYYCALHFRKYRSTIATRHIDDKNWSFDDTQPYSDVNVTLCKYFENLDGFKLDDDPRVSKVVIYNNAFQRKPETIPDLKNRLAYDPMKKL